MTTPRSGPGTSAAPRRNHDHRDGFRGLPPSESGRRTGATWVAATGAALILAAASVFVAVRWDEIDELAKFAILVAFTGLCFNAGLALRRTLPATGSVLVHLGALLVPVNLAAANLRLGLDWRELLLAEGALALGVFAGTARLVQSVVLSAAASAAALAAAAGVAALSGVPAPFVAVAAAAALVVARRYERHAAAWACAAAIAPLTALAFQLLTLDGNTVAGHGVAAELGLLDVHAAWSGAIAAGVALVISIVARRFDQLALVTFAGCGAVAHGLAAWSSLNATTDIAWVAAAALFVLVEIAALCARRDRFWARVGTTAANLTEAAASIGIVAAGLALLDVLNWATSSRSANDGVERMFTPGRGVTVAGFVLVALGYLVADIRRTPGLATLRAVRAGNAPWLDGPIVGAILAAVATSLRTPGMIAIGGVIVGVAWMALRRPAAPMAGCAIGYGVVAGLTDGRFSFGVATVAAVALVCAAIASHRAAMRSDGPEQGIAQGYALLALIAFGAGILAGSETPGSIAVGVAGGTTAWILGCWAMTIVLARVDQDVADIARAAGAASILWLVAFPPTAVWLPASLIIAAGVIESVRSNRVQFALIGVLPAVQLQVAAAQSADLAPASIGLALGAAAFVWLGVAVLLDDRFREPIAATGAATFVVGFVLACTTVATAGPALIALGALGLAGGLLWRQEVLQHGGGAVMTVGVWLLLGVNDVRVSEAFVAPIAAHLLLAGVVIRARSSRGEVSSWLAYGPAIMLLAAPAILERLSGAGAGHAVFAGLVGGAALVVGGWQRQSGSLLLGTLVLGIVAMHETLDAARGVSSWVWLAAGGMTLLAAAVAMERTETSPVEAGRRVVDVLAARFD